MTNKKEGSNEVTVWLKWGLVIMLCLSVGFVIGQYVNLFRSDGVTREVDKAAEILDEMGSLTEERNQMDKQFRELCAIARERMEACEARCPVAPAEDPNPDKNK